MTTIIEVIQHYQRSIDSNQSNEARLIHCINKLYKLPIKVEHLQETGVGKTVNSLRKFNGEIGVAAKALVTKWKAMVAAEEEPVDTGSATNESENHRDENGGDSDDITQPNDEENENHNRSNTSQDHENKKNDCKSNVEKCKDSHKTENSSDYDGHKDSNLQHCEKTKHSNEKHKATSLKEKSSGSSSSSNHKNKERENGKTEHKSSTDKHKHKDHSKEKKPSDTKSDEKYKSGKERKEELPHKSHSSQSKSSKDSSKNKDEDRHKELPSSKEKDHSHKHKSSSKDKEKRKDTTSSKDKHKNESSSKSYATKSTTKDPDSAERKRRHNSDNESVDFKSPPPKVAKGNKSSFSQAETEEGDDSFDSSMGANFDDVLGMLNMPVKKNKKSLKSPTTLTTSCSSSSSSTSKIDTGSSYRQSTSSGSASNDVNSTKSACTSSSATPLTLKISTMKPDLLAPTAKLEPLDPSIALELPTISTNYRPMPLNQTVMDCVFNNPSSTPKPVRTLTDAEAITHGISSKTMRTKIYSGIRTGQTFQVPSLFDMCIRILQKNIDALEYTGGVPFEVLKPVLERASPQQLYVFEEYNPYLMEDSDVLWQLHVSRNYRTKKRIENESWREMFIRCQEEEERRLSVLKDSIKASQKIAAAPVRKTQLAFVDSMVKPPRNILKKQEQFGTKTKLVATPAARVASLSSLTPNAAKTGDQRLKVSPTVRDHAQVSSSSIRPKKAPLMQKTLQFIRGRHKR